ncbi:MAG: hypothetical protein OXP09_06495 [Gammaproteobacteria bacterium]|nr:hypothetical protein [Rhodospirillaceae bacterium]MDE0365208.1 hypothetical protein [Gammaproteobacteria bacterium]
MARRPRKPSDDPLIWFGNSAAADLGRYLYDVLALVMCEMQKSDAKNEATSFDDFRKLLYRHMDALANQANLIARAKVIDAQMLKCEMEMFLALETE